MSVVQSSISKMLGKARELFANKIAQPIQRAYTQADIKPVLQAVSPAFNVANNLYQAAQSAQRFNSMPLGPNKISINQAVQQIAPNAAAGFGRMISGQGVMPSAYSNTAGRYIGNFAQNLVGIAPSVVDRNKNFGQKVGDFTGSAGAAMSGLTGLSGLGGNLAQTAIGTGLQYAGAKLGNQPFNLGQALDQSQRLGYQAGAVAGVTNPLVAQSLAKVQGGARLAGAGANVAQGMLIDKATGQQTTPLSAGTDFALGLIGGPQQFSGDIKGVKRGALRVAGDIEQTQKMALERMRVDPNFADQAGMIKVGNKYRIIHPEDRARMVELIDYSRLGGSRKAQNRQLELDATRIAEKYGIRTPKTLGGLANEFDKTLRDIKKVNPNKWLGQAGFIAGPKAFGYKDAPNKFSSLIDKKPRFEVDDSGAKIKPEAIDVPTMNKPGGSLKQLRWGATLSDYLDHPELFKQYPELKNAEVLIDTRMYGDIAPRGNYDPTTNKISIRGDLSPSEAKSTLLHEIQHAIQKKEGFARGGSPEAMADRFGEAGQLNPEAFKIRNEIRVLRNSSQWPDINKTSNDEWSRFKTSPLYKKVQSLEEQLLEKQLSPTKLYQRIAGEVEARAVQNRMDMPAGQRPMTDPYAAETIATVGSADPNKLITRFGDGEAMSVKVGDDPLIQEARKYKTTVNLQDKNDLDYLERIFSKDTINDIKNGKMTNWRGENYSDLARVNFISETPKTIEQQLAGKIKDVKLKNNTFYHGTNSNAADSIMQSGFKRGSDLPSDAIRGGGYGKIQNSISLAETPKEASIFSSLTPNGKIIETKLKDNAKVVSIDGIEDAIDLEDYIKYLRKQKIDAVYIGGGEKELVVLNPKSVIPIKSQLTKNYNQANTTKNIFGQTIPVPPKGQAGLVDLNAEVDAEKAIKEARQSIGSIKQEQGKSLSESADEFYRDWVNKYAPLETVGREVKARLKVKGAELRPEYDPEYALKRVLGTGGIANYKYDSELKPIIDEAASLKIDKVDLDAYLKARRDVGFGTAGRNIYGSDPVKAAQQVAAFEQKYGQNISGVAQKLYNYQNSLLDQLAESGFISKDKLNIIRQQNPDYVPFQRVIDDNLVDEFVGIGKKSVQQATNPIVKIKGSDKQVYSPLESIIGNTYRYTSAIEKNNFVKKFLALENDVPQLKFDLADKAGDDTISVWVNGTKQYRRVGEDVARAVKGLDQETMGIVERILSAPATLLRTGATGMNPEFMGPNVIRDQFEAALNSKYGYVPFVDYFRGLSHLINKDRTGADALVDSWLASGGAQEFANISGRKSVSELIDSKEAKKGLFAWLANGLEKMGRYSEVPTRLGLYEKALKATKNPTIAAFESREGTMDFARMGAKMKVANSLIPFLNVQVQGLDKIIRNVANKPGQSLMLAGLYGVAPQVMTSAYNLMFYPQEYSEIPQYEKDGNIIVIVGRGEDGQVKYLSFPKANSLQLVQNPIENFMAYAAGANPQSFSEMATSLISSSLPVVGDGSSMGEVGLKTVGNLIPQAIKPLAEVLLNKSFFKYNTTKEEAKEIVPYYLKKLPAGDQSYDWTPALYKAAGKILNVSPLQVQTIAEGYLAGFTKIPNQIVDTLNSISKGERVSPNDITILRRFVKETYPTTSSSPTPAQPSTGLVEKANANGFFGWFAPREQKLETDPTRIKARFSAQPSTLKPEELYTYYTRETNLNSASQYERAMAEKKIWSRLSDLESSDSLSDQQKSQTRALLLEKVGITPEDYQYYEVAKQTNALKSMYAKEELTKLLTTGADKQQVYNWLADNRREVNGNQVLTSGVIDSLVDANIISYADGAALKKLQVTGTGKKRSVSSKKKSSKIRVPKPKKISFKVSTPKVKKIAAKKFKPVKLKNVSIRLKARRIA